MKVHIRRCSRWVICGFTLLVLGLLCCGLYFWYASTYFADDPIIRDASNFLHTPRSDARVGALCGAGVVILFASVLGLIGIAKGPRTRRCLALGLIAPLAAALPFLRQLGQSLMEWLHAL